MAAAATDLLARLQVLLDADTAEFDRNITGAADTADKGFSRIVDKAKGMGLAVAAAAATALGGMTALTEHTITQASEISTLATQAGIGAEQFQYYAAGAKTLGIEQDKLADIFADASEKMGEFVATEGGGLADFFTNIAPKVGITQEAFAKLSGPEGLLKIVEASEKLGLSYNQTRYYLESYASDATTILPLLQKGGEGFKLYGDQAERFGAILSDDVIANSGKLEAAQYMLQMQSQGLKNELVVGTIPTFTKLAIAFSDTTSDGDKFLTMSTFIDTALVGMAKGAAHVAGFFKFMGNEIAHSLAKQTIIRESMGDAPWWEIQTADEILAAKLKVNNKLKALDEDYANNKKKIHEETRRTIDSLSSDDAVNAALAKAQAVQDALKKASGYGVTGELGKAAAEEAAKQAKAESDAAAKAAQNAADQIQKAYESQAQGLERQIALFDITTTAAQLKYDLENTEMAKFAPQQKAYLQGLAQELDYKKQDKLYLDSYNSASHEATALKFKYEISRQIYELQIQSNEKYKELAEDRRNTLLDMEIQNRVTGEYKSLVEGLQNSEESRYSSVADQLSTLNFALQIGVTDATAYADQLQRIFDSSSVLPDFSTGTMDVAGVEAAQMELENRYAVEAQIRQQALDEKLISEQEYQQNLLNLELDYNLRKTDLEDQMKQAQLARQKGYQDTAVSFFTKGLDVMANSSEKYSKVAKAAQKALALYQIGKDTAAAAMAAYKAVVGIPIVGPTLAPIAAGAAIAFGAMQAKAVLSDSNAAATAVTPSTPATTVTPVAEQPTVEDTKRQTTTVQIPADTLFTGRQMVDLLNEALADGKRLDTSSLSFIGV